MSSQIVRDLAVIEKPEASPGFSLRVLRYARGSDWALIITSFIANFAGGLITPVFMRSFGGMIDSVSIPGGRDMLFFVKLLLALAGGAFVLSFIGATTMEFAAERQLRRMKSEFLRSLTQQEMGWYDEFNAGKLSTTLSQNTTAIRDGIGLKMSQFFMYSGMFLGGYAMGFWANWKITLVVSAGLPATAGAGYLMMRELGQSDSLSRKAYAAAAAVVEETLLSIKTVAAYGLEPRCLDLFMDNLQASYRAGIRTSFGVGITMGLMFAAFFCVQALGFWYGGKLVGDDLDQHGLMCFVPEEQGGAKCVQGGEVLSVFFCVILGTMAITQAGPSITAIAKASSAAAELEVITSRRTKIDPNDQTKPMIDNPRGEIVFEAVEFAYPTRQDRPVFAGLNLTLEAGKSTALVGASGCGKSTIIQLIERYYDISGGRLLLDGTDIRDVNLSSWRHRVALVSQEPKLFASTIRENIRTGRLDATDAEIEEAAKQANAHDFIKEFPNGYETFVGQSGGQLSGGQKQRIAIARAILRNPAVLILDEATSALDNESEKIVQETLDKLVEGSQRTTIIIAHRLTTVRRADRIVVLQNDGSGATVAESGTHEELMKINEGTYKSLVEAQNLGVDESESAAAAHSIAVTFADLPARSRSKLELYSKYSRELSKADMTLPAVGEAGPKKKGPGTFWKVTQVLAPYWAMVLAGLVGAIANGAVFPVYVIIFSKLLGALYLTTADGVRHEGSVWALALVGLAVGVLVAAGVQNGMFTWAGVKVVRETRRRLFTSILYQDQSFFDDPRNSLGVLSDMLAGDAILVRGLVGDNVGLYVQNIVCVIIAIIVTFTTNAKLGGVAIAAFVLMAPGAMLEAQFENPPTVDTSKLKGDTVEDVQSSAFIIQECILNIRTVAAYNLSDDMCRRYQLIVDKDYRQGRLRSVITGIAWGFSQFSQFGCQSLMLWYGSRLVSNGEIDTEHMFRGIMALMMAAVAVGSSMSQATDIGKARAAADRIYTVYERTPLVDSRTTEKREFTGLEHALNFDGVKFAYPQRPDVIVHKNLTFQINKGETVAIVGQSGCGKSTVVQLLERFYPHGSEGFDPDDGAGVISYDKADMRDFNVRSLRQKIGLVSQEPNLFEVGVRENIELGKYGQDVTWSEVEAAARAANAYDFVQQFPEGFDTNVGRFGDRLSGGQKQRVAIARAIIRDPEILILDEATSALDAESEEIVQAALDKLIQESHRTTIVIAHRLSTVKKANKIVVLVNRGGGTEVAEIGTHNELLRIEGGVYRRLVEITNQAM